MDICFDFFVCVDYLGCYWHLVTMSIAPSEIYLLRKMLTCSILIFPAVYILYIVVLQIGMQYGGAPLEGAGWLWEGRSNLGWGGMPGRSRHQRWCGALQGHGNREVNWQGIPVLHSWVASPINPSRRGLPIKAGWNLRRGQAAEREKRAVRKCWWAA